jgi:hypothetical protein
MLDLQMGNGSHELFGHKNSWEFKRSTHQHDENIRQHERQYHGESFNGAYD